MTSFIKTLSLWVVVGISIAANDLFAQNSWPFLSPLSEGFSQRPAKEEAWSNSSVHFCVSDVKPLSRPNSEHATRWITLWARPLFYSTFVSLLLLGHGVRTTRNKKIITKVFRWVNDVIILEIFETREYSGRPSVKCCAISNCTLKSLTSPPSKDVKQRAEINSSVVWFLMSTSSLALRLCSQEQIRGHWAQKYINEYSIDCGI